MRLPSLRHSRALTCLAALSLSVALAQCATPGKDGPTFQKDSYFVGSGVAQNTTVTLGAQRLDLNASTAGITPGDLLLLVQMQDAPISNTNAVTYGDGSTGRGVTSLRDAGHYEFAVVTAVNGTVVTLKNPLQYTYTQADATATEVRQRFQVIRVPQHSSTSLPGGTVTVPAWDGSTGGIFALDVSGTLTLAGTTVDATASGFRGGGGFTNNVQSGSGVSDYAAVYVAGASRGAMKGEGISGTPTLVRGPTPPTNGTAALGAGDLGYPAGLVVARGAPGNAGGGGTQHNSGGGGGGNAGQGGQGGYSYGTYRTVLATGCRTLTSGAVTYYSCAGDGSRDVGGLGGAAFTPSGARLLAGGGGGAGDTNNSSDNPAVSQNAGGAGGGIIFVRAANLAGSGTFRAGGQAGLPAGRDAGGGGGAGGTVAVVVPPGAYPGLTVQVPGGAGGNSGLPLRGGETQGTGGGGGGGAVLLPTGVSVGTVDVSGGAPGVNTPATGISNTYGSAAGNGGIGNLIYSNAGVILPGLCSPQLSVQKSTGTPERFVNSAEGTYSIQVQNGSGRGDALDVTVSDPALPSTFRYVRTRSIVLTGGASRSSVSDPAVGSAAPVWGSFTLPGGSSVTVTFDVTLNSPPAGRYDNSAAADAPDPARTVATARTTVSYDGTAATASADDVTVYTPPNVTLQKFVRNVTQGTVFGTANAANPGEALEYCIAYRNVGGYRAPNLVIRDTVPAGSLALTSAYGAGLGVRVLPAATVDGDPGPASGTDLTSDADTDAADLAAALTFRVGTLAAGAEGSVCFQVTVP